MIAASKIHESWKPILEELKNDTELKILRKEILPNIKYYPERENIFNVFQMPLNDIRVVILGQDPYPNKGQAIGYAFAVAEDVNKPVSMRIIEKEVGYEIDRTLSKWIDQGVFLLNTALTVEAGKAGSHLKYWTKFTEKLILFISENIKPIWILWGSKAQYYRAFINPPKVVKIKSELSIQKGDFNYILEAPHPASESYSGGKAGFYGCDHFNLVNKILELNNKDIIVW